MTAFDRRRFGVGACPDCFGSGWHVRFSGTRPNDEELSARGWGAVRREAFLITEHRKCVPCDGSGLATTAPATEVPSAPKRIRRSGPKLSFRPDSVAD